MAKKKKKGEPRNWIVKMRCVVIKEVYCSDCSEDEAHDDPFNFSKDERELEQEDWQVISVEPNV